MATDAVRADIEYQKEQLDNLREELFPQPNFFRLVDDVVSRRDPKVILNLPIQYKNLEVGEVLVKYDDIESVGQIEYLDIKAPEVNVERKTLHLYGAGRTGLEDEALAMRFLQMGFDVSIPGTTTAKPVKDGDLCIFCSGSWGTISTTNYAKAAKELGATVVGITSHPELAKNDCDYCIEVGGREKLGKQEIII